MKVSITCDWCGKEFYRIKKKVNESKKKGKKIYCCRKCQNDGNKESQSDEYTMFRTMFHSAKDHARRKNKQIDITLDDIKSLWEKQGGKCNLSGDELVFGKTVYDKKHGGNTASLDRINNDNGYLKDNIQIIHKLVNHLKSNMSQNVFIEWCEKIAATAIDKQTSSDTIDTRTMEQDSAINHA